MPFVLYVLFGDSENRGLVLMVPFFGFIPIIIYVTFILWPIENWLDKSGKSYLTYIAIPALGFIIGFCFSLQKYSNSILVNGPDRNPSPGFWYSISTFWGEHVFFAMIGLAISMAWLFSRFIVNLHKGITFE